MDNGFYGNYQNVPQQNKGAGCLGCGSSCFGCLGGCLAIFILLTLISAGATWYTFDKYGYTLFADAVDKTVTAVVDEGFKDENAKKELIANVKNFTDKIRNKEIGMVEAVKGFTSLQKGGYMERIALLGMYGESQSKDTVVNDVERTTMSQVIKGIYDGKINTESLATFTMMLSMAADKNGEGYNGYQKGSTKKMDPEKLHKALDYLKSFAAENKLEIPAEGEFNFEQYVTKEVDSLLKAVMINGKAEQSEPSSEK